MRGKLRHVLAPFPKHFTKYREAANYPKVRQPLQRLTTHRVDTGRPLLSATIMRDKALVTFSPSPGTINVSQAKILVDEADHEGIKIAARLLSQDFSKITHEPQAKVIQYIAEDESIDAQVVIIVGCIESSRVLQHLERIGRVDFTSIRGKWESFATSVVDNPVEGIEKAFVIAGSDKRGTIYGIYTLSEQIGVSPYGSRVCPQY